MPLSSYNRVINPDSFNSFCDKGMCLRGTPRSKNCDELWRRQECYEKYLRQQASMQDKPTSTIKPGGRSQDPKWNNVRAEIMERDGGICRLLAVLTESELASMQNTPGIRMFGTLSQVIDPAHIFPVGSHPEIMYESWNIIALNRFFHTRLDELHHPLTGKPISAVERIQWMLYARDGCWYIL